MKYSVIVLLENRTEDFSEFVNRLHEIFLSTTDVFEIVIVANGTEGFLKNELLDIKNSDGIRAFALSKTTQAICLKAAFNECSGEIIMVCESYQQITMDSFIKLLQSFDEDTDIISPWRQKRVDSKLSRLQSEFFNILVRKIIGTQLHDLSCTVKMFRREVLEETDLYGNMYRFLPIIASQKGFKNKEVKCEHYQERGKSGFYGISEYLTRIIDIFTLYFNTRFTRKPLRFFSAIGVTFLSFGFLTTLYVFIEKIFMHRPIGDRLSLLAAVFLVVFGIQVASVGLLGEIIAFTFGRRKREYTIEKEI
jgi:hypothetical protein